MSQNCFHCGLPVPENTHFIISDHSRSEPACCAGCQAVAQTIIDAGLGDYYRHREVSGKPAETLPQDLLQQIALYDSELLQQSFVRTEPNNIREAALMLEGITCAACVWLNEQQMLRLPGILSVDINYTSHRARVRWDNSQTHLSTILEAVAAIGYRAHPYDSARQELLQQKERKQAINRLWVAGLSMMQVMALDAYRANDTQRLAKLAAEMPADPLQTYPSYWLTLKALEQDNDAQVSHFLDQNPDSVLSERIRRDWLKKLGKRQSWASFETEWRKLPAEGRDEETQCYGDVLSLRQGRAPGNLDRFLESRTLPEGCNTLISAAAARGLVNQEWLWKRLRLLLAGNFTSQARQLASDTGLAFDSTLLNNPGRADLSTRQGQEAMC